MKKIEISEEDFFWLVISKIDKTQRNEKDMLYQAVKFLASRNEDEKGLFYQMFTEKMDSLDISKVDGVNQLDLNFIKAWVIGMGAYYYHSVLEKPDVVLEGKGKTFHQLLYLKDHVDEYLEGLV